MKNYQNQLDRFSDIAKKLVDNHSADMFNVGRAATSGPGDPQAAYSNHLDNLGKELDQHAQQFLTSGQKVSDENLKTDIWGICRKYLDQFVKRNQPDTESNY